MIQYRALRVGVRVPGVMGKRPVRSRQRRVWKSDSLCDYAVGGALSGVCLVFARGHRSRLQSRAEEKRGEGVHLVRVIDVVEHGGWVVNVYRVKVYWYIGRSARDAKKNVDGGSRSGGCS
jgi:hypothetical protein